MDSYGNHLNSNLYKNFETLSKSQQKAVYNLYQNLLIQYTRKIALAKSDAIETKLMVAMTKELADGLCDIIKDYGIQLTKKQLEAVSFISDRLNDYNIRFPDTDRLEVKRIIGNTARQNYELMARGKMYDDGVGLSERLWNVGDKLAKDVVSSIKTMTASGVSAKQLSKDLVKFCNPATRRQLEEKYGKDIAQKKLEYNGMRLARTTYTHLGQMAVKDYQRVNPYANKVKWHSDCTSRSCDLCISRNGKIFDADKMPFDHPNGLCWQTVEFDKSMKEMASELREWANGQPNKLLDDWAKANGIGKPKTTTKSTSKSSAKATATKAATNSNMRKIDPNLKTDRDWIINNDKNYATLKEVNEGFADKYVERLLDSPEWYRQMMTRMSEVCPLNIFPHTNKGGYYSPKDSGVHMDLNKDRWGGKGCTKMATYFHEYGHNISHRFKGNGINAEYVEDLMSNSPKFKKAIEADVAELKRMSKKYDWFDEDYVREDFRTNSKYVDDEDEDLINWDGVSDNLNGMLGWKLGAGHSDEYWKERPYIKYEECWANICSCYMNQARKNAMEQYFPNAMKAFEELVCA